MLQTIEGKEVYVVDFDTMPELPLRWETAEEMPYTQALALAIHNGIISEPGKYGIYIEVRDGETYWQALAIIEDKEGEDDVKS
jgi:hypothetical protein